MKRKTVTTLTAGLLLSVGGCMLVGCSQQIRDLMADPEAFVASVQDKMEGVPPREPGEPGERGEQGDWISLLIGLAALAVGVPAGGKFYEGVLRPRRLQRENKDS